MAHNDITHICDAKTIGIVGLGIMGGAMARNLVAAGWQVLGFDPDTQRASVLEAQGIAMQPTLDAVIHGAPILLMSLAKPQAVQATAAVIAAAGVAPRVVIEASTLTLADKLALAETLAQAGHIPLDCPISGTGAQAEVKDLVIYASGESAAIAALRPCFAAFSRALHDLGAYGNGSRMKYVANLLVAINNVATAEAMVLGIKAGLDPAQIVALISGGAGNSRVFELRAPLMAQQDYDHPTMKIDVWQKDMAIIGQFATALGCPTPMLNATMPIYASAMATGRGGQDTAAVCAVLEAMAGVARA